MPSVLLYFSIKVLLVQRLMSFIVTYRSSERITTICKRSRVPFSDPLYWPACNQPVALQVMTRKFRSYRR